MINALTQFFLMITLFINGITRFVRAFDKLAESAEDHAEAFRDESKLNLRAKRAELEKRLQDAPKVTKSSKDFDL